MRLFRGSILSALLVFAGGHAEARPVLRSDGHQRWALDLGNNNDHLLLGEEVGSITPFGHEGQAMSEPQSMAMMSIGLFLVGHLLRRSKSKA